MTFFEILLKVIFILWDITPILNDF
jgi:hypothetical protein